MANRKDVAMLAGVSPATVSNVFERPKVVKEETREKVFLAAKQLKYVPNHAARTLSLGTSRHIGVAVFEYTNPQHMEVIRGIEDHAIRHDYMVTMFLMDGNIKDKTSFIQSKQLSALINFTTNEYPVDFMDVLQNTGTLLVDFGAEKGLSTMIDMTDAYRDIFTRLQAFGHKKVAFVTGIDKMRFACDKRGKIFAKRAEYGFCTDEDLITYSNDYSLKSEDRGYIAMKRLLQQRRDMTAVLAMNDLTAIGAIYAINEAGLSVPNDISIVGCDDISLSKYVRPSLTTISCDQYAFGKKIAEAILDCISKKETGIGRTVRADAVPVYRESIAQAKI